MLPSKKVDDICSLIDRTIISLIDTKECIRDLKMTNSELDYIKTMLYDHIELIPHAYFLDIKLE